MNLSINDDQWYKIFTPKLASFLYEKLLIWFSKISFFLSRLEMESNSKISSEEEKKKADRDISLEEKADFESKKEGGKISLEEENKNTNGENQKEDGEDNAISDWDE